MVKRPAPRQEPETHTNFLREWASVLVTFGGFAVALTVWYATTNSTLNQHSRDIQLITEALKKEADQRESAGNKYMTMMEKEADSRQHVRDEFISIMQKNQESLGQLNAAIAVQGAKYDTLITQLNKLSDVIDKQNGKK